MEMKFQNFLIISYFFPKCSKIGTLQGTNFFILVFFWPYMGLVKVRKGTLTSGGQEKSWILIKFITLIGSTAYWDYFT